MINDDILIKYSLQRLSEGYQPTSRENNWVDYTRLLKKQLLDCKLGFPGIGDGDISLIRPSNVKVGMRVILDDNLDYNRGRLSDSAPILGVIESISPDILLIEGIGCGYDFERDPDRLLKWRDHIEVNLLDYQTIIHVTAIPRCDGGSVYYYFNKHNRDSRY